MKKKMSLPVQILIALVLGVIVGLVCYMTGTADFTAKYLKPFGTIFVNLLKFIVVPVVLISIICGMISMDDVKKVGSVGWKTVVYYMCTTLVAIVIGLVVANLFKGFFPVLETTGLEYEAQSSNFMDTIVNIFPSNMWSAFVNANMLQVIVIALLFGAGILVCGEKKARSGKMPNRAEKFALFTLDLEAAPANGGFCQLLGGVQRGNG